MKVVDPAQIKDELINNMRRSMLIPVIGSGFTRGCPAFRGSVPSGQDYRTYMIGKIAAQLSLQQDEVEQLKRESFSNLSDTYQRAIPVDEQKEYLKCNFTNVRLDDNKKRLLESFWPYIYTLNIDDGIEKNSCYDHIVYANRPVEKGVFDDFPCVIKLHGDVKEMLTYEDAKSEIFSQKQYVDSLHSNASLLGKLQHDLLYQNLIFIGCSLDDEIDLLSCSPNSVVDTAKYFCTTKTPGKLEHFKYEKYGITHCIVFDSYEEMYGCLYEVAQEAQKISIDDLEDYKQFSFTQIPADYERNKSYLFFGKSLVNKDHTISLPYFFISRTVTDAIFDRFSTAPLQFIVGSGCSGKTYILIDIARRIKNRDVFLFETKDRLTAQAFDDLTRKDNCVILADDTSLSADQVEYFISHVRQLKEKNINVIIAAEKHDRDVSGILKLYELQQIIRPGEIPQIPISNMLNEQECRQLSPLLTAVTVGIFQGTDTIVDNIINLSRALSEKNKYHDIVPHLRSEKDLAALIALAIERKIYSVRAARLELYDELFRQYKATAPLIEQETTWSFETSFDDNSPQKYVVNAVFWLCYQLRLFAHKESNHPIIVKAYKYLIMKILSYEGKPDLWRGDRHDLYRKYILFDNINKIFSPDRYTGEKGLALIREIYEGSNELLSADPNYMHQRAKCYIKSAYFERDKKQKATYLEKAFRDANVAYQVFESRYNEYHNEKVRISADHVLYTKALVLCHKCYTDAYASVHDNTAAVHALYEALRSPYNTYDFVKKDAFNYRNVVSKMIQTAMAQKTLISPDAYADLEDLFRIISE